MKHLSLVDGSGYIYRAFYALSAMNRSDGTPINAVYGFCSMMLNLVERSSSQVIAVVFDKGGPTFRHTLYSSYKAHRPPPPKDLIPQFALIRRAAEAFGFPVLEKEGVEADDVIASYADHAHASGISVTILSSDKDLMQLVRPHVTMWDPVKELAIGPDQVMEKFGVPPHQVIDVQALAGDASDNVPGVRSIGVKTAARLITEYGSLENLLENVHNLKRPSWRARLTEEADMAVLSKSLVTLKRDLPLLLPLESLTPHALLDQEKLCTFFKEQEFAALLRRLKVPVPTQEIVVEQLRTEEHLQNWCRHVQHHPVLALMACDTDAYAGLAMATEDKQCSLSWQDLPWDTVRTHIGPLLEDPGLLKVGYDMKHLKKLLPCPVSPVDDVSVMAFLVHGGRRHTLESLVSLYGSFGAHLSLAKDSTLQERISWTGALVRSLYETWTHLKNKVLTEHMIELYEVVERPLIQVLSTMEARGICVSASELRALSTTFRARLTTLEEKIHTQAQERFNLASPGQLGRILFEKLKLPGGKTTKTGVFSTRSDILESLRSHHSIIDLILEWRRLSKLTTTYTDALLKAIDPAGRIHTSYLMTGAQTGRLSSVEPNLQNIPTRTEEGRMIRRAFKASPGFLLLSLDYSQIELRILAEMACLSEMKDAFLEGRDIHAMTACEVFGVSEKTMDPTLRQRAKAINFGIIYGISAFGLARQIGVTDREARQFIQRYFQRFPGIVAFMNRTKNICREKGGVHTLFGRRIQIPEVNDSSHGRRQYAERQAINAPIQGTAADIIKRAMVKLPGTLAQEGLSDVHPLLQVHDELIFEVPEERVEAVIPPLRLMMEEAPLPMRALSVPLTVDVQYGPVWEK